MGGARDHYTTMAYAGKDRLRKKGGYRKFSEKNNQWEIRATLDLSPVSISKNMDLAVNIADTTSWYFLKTWATLNS